MKIMISNSGVYDCLKYLQRIALPAVLALFVAICEIWELPVPVAQISATVAAVETFLGIILQISTNNYDDVMNTLATYEEDAEG